MRVTVGGIMRQEMGSDMTIALLPLADFPGKLLQRQLIGCLVVQPVDIAPVILHQPDSRVVAQP